MRLEDIKKGTFKEIINQLKIYCVLKSFPKLAFDNIALKQKLQHTSIFSRIMKKVQLKVISSEKYGNNLWFNSIGTNFKLTKNSCSIFGIGLIKDCGNYSMNDDKVSESLIFELVINS